MSRLAAFSAALFLLVPMMGCGAGNTGPTADPDELSAYLDEHGDQTTPEEDLVPVE
ncbi:hypothetical protein [Novipirellula rosea]|uniref:Secreted protein n=1 Tax=Novipirellula rosea TaxID=1031540 RepID=A0ABP8MQT3_9BACT|tara:strand:+ start:5646 stop:5813 length:168 start_codon:yes stop_codon:yes gene_type:complete